ncbi:MAG TPA: hypothetical protein DF296_05130 [Candidatus Margulisbacteria bacterium]|nr:MAG: hypothetical protein A2X43_04130 [Candidatus Margulisbacteria bacterium GWD2_39_127]HAR64524.1 hypothetical protein [Candidatus Margulisiibacteriota bacterium]HCT84563.1 hypothetical protein [Candidatus Margulisiibacteriota bacterium]
MKKNLSNIIKKSTGDSFSISSLAMETFHSQVEYEALEQDRSNIIEQGKEEATRIKEDAQAVAHAIVETAKREAVLIKESAREEGYKQGLGQARNEIEDEFSAGITAIQNIKQMIDKNLVEIFQSIENHVLEIIFEIAKKIVGYEVKANKAIVLEIITKCLAKTRERNHIIIKVNHNDFDMVEEKKEYFQRKVRGLKMIDIEESDQVFEGGCIIETSVGDINGDIEEQFHKIKDVFLNE